MDERDLREGGGCEAIVYPLQLRGRASRVDGQAVAAECTGLELAPGLGRIFGASPAMLEVYRMVERVAPTDAAVMVSGESGCGKELVAQTLHALSDRRARPFVAVNCGALPANLVEAELFGYERGSFTGALKSHRGHFERAAGGTLFLDEIGQMPADTQVKLLRVLENGDYFHVGGEKELKADVRIIAATNCPSLEAMRAGNLREDLFYRLAVFPIELPPLRERGDDIVLLARHFLHLQNRHHGTDKVFSEAFLERMRSYSWPGNVRELQNCICRAYILAERVLDLPSVAPPEPSPREQRDGVLEFPVGTSLADIERDTIYATLARCAGNKRRTAQMLGVSLKTLYNRLNEYASASRPDSASGAVGSAGAGDGDRLRWLEAGRRKGER